MNLENTWIFHAQLLPLAVPAVINSVAFELSGTVMDAGVVLGGGLPGGGFVIFLLCAITVGS
jgi:hypothetical protein